MSHFSVIVIGENVEAQLEPYAEQEFAPEFGVFEDVEDAEFKKYNEELVEIVTLKNGEKKISFDSQFSHFDHKTMTTNRVFPEGSTLSKILFKEFYPTFEEYMNEWCGTNSRDFEKNRYGHWYNPNAKWDWYQVGGRWSNFFKTNEGAANEVLVKDIDILGMKEEAKVRANNDYDELEKVLKGRPLPSWKKVLEECGGDIDKARIVYRDMEVVNDLNDAKFFTFEDLTDVFCNSREEYIVKCLESVLMPFAFVKDGQWYSRGDMGWFGCVSDEKDDAEWKKSFSEVFESLSPDTKLTIVDCHI